MAKHPYINSPDSKKRLAKLTHRAYVGGLDSELWYGLGKLQYHFLIANGLRPEHTFLDIACGSFRLGQYLIPYLNRGNYYGLEAEEELVQKGQEAEFYFDLFELRAPNITINSTFDFSFIDNFDFAMAQSLFTHLIPEDISHCMNNLKQVASDSSLFFFTYLEGEQSLNELNQSHANVAFYYTFEEFESFAGADWQLTKIGHWNHPRNQLMVKAQLK